MRRGVIVLVVVAVVSVVAYCLYYQCATRPLHAMMKQPEAEMEWLRREFDLTEAQFGRIRIIHATYRPKCEAMCQRIGEANAKLGEAIEQNAGMTPQVEAALRTATEVQQECRQAMLTHIYSVSAEMNPASAKRYLELMKPRIAQSALPPDTAVTRSTNE